MLVNESIVNATAMLDQAVADATQPVVSTVQQAGSGWSTAVINIMSYPIYSSPYVTINGWVIGLILVAYFVGKLMSNR